MLFLWLKTLHLVATVAWFAGLFYLPRLFVYHANAKDSIGIERFKIMEYRLYHAITYPAAIVSTLSGLGLLHLHWAYLPIWMVIKLALVAVLWVYHLQCGQLLKHFRLNQNRHSAGFYRVFNEVPTVLLIAIVAMVVVRPF